MRCPNCGAPADAEAAPDDPPEREWLEGYDRMCQIGTAADRFAGWRFFHGVT